jgi:hypothetical protein
MLALRPLVERPASAQSSAPYSYLFIERSGAWRTPLGNAGMVVIDLRNGNRWGVPFIDARGSRFAASEKATYLGSRRHPPGHQRAGTGRHLDGARDETDQHDHQG